VTEQLFIADLHLSSERPDTLALFLRFLAERAPQADALYILGDLFDAWVGDDDGSSLATQVQTALKDLTDTGTAVFIQHGNRDFLIGETFLQATGAQLLDEATVLQLGGKRTLLMHGDLLCTDDVDYQQARRMLRAPAFIADFLARPLAERVALAARYRQQSGEATSLKAEDIMDVSPLTVVEYARQHDAERLIHGHTHRPGRHVHQVDGREVERWVLSEWHPAAGEALCLRGEELIREPVH
jgi:UDP-2,3-diacylglucosamine hydrolase